MYTPVKVSVLESKKQQENKTFTEPQTLKQERTFTTISLDFL